MAKNNRKNNRPQQYFGNKSTGKPEIITAAPAEANFSPEEKLVISDERVQEKLAELETEKAQLEEDYQKRKKEQDDRAKDLDSREGQTLKDMEDLRAQQVLAREEARGEILKDEQAIRAEEYQRIQSNWQAELEKRREELEAELEGIRKEADTERAYAHEERMKAEREHVERVRQDDLRAEESLRELTKACEQKFKDVVVEIARQKKSREELERREAELAADEAYVSDLKKRYELFSENEVRKLKIERDRQKNTIEGLQKLINEQADKITRYDVMLSDMHGQKASDRIEALERQLRERDKQLEAYREMPSADRIEELCQHEKELMQYQEKVAELQHKLQEAQMQVSNYLINSRQLENERVVAEALKSLNDQLQERLRYISDQYDKTKGKKFQGLLEIDAQQLPSHPRQNNNFTNLAALVKHVRNYGASTMGLYYSEEMIRVFVASLAASQPASRLLILQGLSGTGKSSLPILFSRSIGAGEGCRFISVQPSWRDNRELLGYDNDFTNRFKETEFTKSLYQASRDDSVLTFIVLDEMNLARIEYYFADFLSILESRTADEWLVPLMPSFDEAKEDRPHFLNYSGGNASLVITKNIWFVGTANNDDSTSLITDKVYDRAQILDMDERAAEFSAPQVTPKAVSRNDLEMMFEKARGNAQNKLTPEDKDVLDDLDEQCLKTMDITFGNRIKSQLEDFVPVYIDCGGTKEDAIDYYLAHKILRKLDEKYDTYILGCLDELEMYLEENYPGARFAHSKKKIEQIRKHNFGKGEA